MNWYLEVWKKFAVFDGRAGRSEYWFFTLFNVIIYVVLGIIGALIKFPFLPLIYLVAVLIPSLAVTVRRLHDTDRTGWWILLGIVPFGGIVIFIFTVMGSTPGDNRYGSEP